MNKRVLISFLGTGASEIVNGNIRPMRKYRTANYQIDGTLYKDYSFMSAALVKHYNIGKILMVGTVHSMWDTPSAIIKLLEDDIKQLKDIISLT